MKCGIIYNVKTRLDILLTQRKIVDSRSQAESYIKLFKKFNMFQERVSSLKVLQK